MAGKTKKKIEEKEITVYITRDSFCMGDDAMAPNIRRFTIAKRESLQTLC